MIIKRQISRSVKNTGENYFFPKTKALRLCIITALTTLLIIGLDQYTYAQAWYNELGIP